MPYRLLNLSFRTRAWLLLAIVVLVPALATAQAYELRVALHDAAGRALAGITVILTDEHGLEISRAVTNAERAARFNELPAVVRVAVEGQARGGPQLFQLGDDARGVRVDLAQGERQAVLNLRVERDGLVLPDPATMLTLEEGGPIFVETTLIPTAALGTPALSSSASTSADPGTVSVDAAPARTEQRRNDWAPLLAALVIAVAGGVMLFLQRRGDAQ